MKRCAVAVLRLITGRRVNHKRLAELERADLSARRREDIEWHLARIYRFRDEVRAELDLMFDRRRA